MKTKKSLGPIDVYHLIVKCTTWANTYKHNRQVNSICWPSNRLWSLLTTITSIGYSGISPAPCEIRQRGWRVGEWMFLKLIVYWILSCWWYININKESEAHKIFYDRWETSLLLLGIWDPLKSHLVNVTNRPSLNNTLWNKTFLCSKYFTWLVFCSSFLLAHLSIHHSLYCTNIMVNVTIARTTIFVTRSPMAIALPTITNGSCWWWSMMLMTIKSRNHDAESS